MRRSNVSYGELLRDPRWQRKRMEIMTRDGWCCRVCLSRTITLNVHHTYYSTIAEGPWDYHNDALVTLCEKCHHEGHERDAQFAVKDAVVISQSEKDAALRKIKNQLAEWRRRNGLPPNADYEVSP